MAEGESSQTTTLICQVLSAKPDHKIDETNNLLRSKNFPASKKVIYLGNVATTLISLLQLPETPVFKNKPKYNVKTSSASDYIERYCSNLNLSNEICEICKKAAQKATEYSIVEDNTPPSIAAGTIYMICNLYSMNITKKNVSKACKISEVTISKCFKKMNKYKKHLVDNIPKNKKKKSKSKKKSTKKKSSKK